MVVCKCESSGRALHSFPPVSIPWRLFAVAARLCLCGLDCAALAAGLDRAWRLLARFGRCVLLLALRPAIEIHETHLPIGRKAIAWSDIRRLDQTGWNAPLAVYLTLADEQRDSVSIPGDLDSSPSLLRHLRRYSRERCSMAFPIASSGAKRRRLKTAERGKSPRPRIRYPCCVPRTKKKWSGCSSA